MEIWVKTESPVLEVDPIAARVERDRQIREAAASHGAAEFNAGPLQTMVRQAMSFVLQPEGAVAVPAEPPKGDSYSLNGAQTVAVSNFEFWDEDMAVCPRGVKVQLLGRGGVATYGTYQPGDDFWTAWAPVPRRRPK